MRAGVALGGAGLAAAAAAAACVRIETGPEGLQSAQFQPPAPPSVVVGDVLRDSAGAPVTLGAVGFDDGGRPIAGLRPRYTYIPLVDTTVGALPDTALVVDSVTGAVRATSPFKVATARVGAVLGERLQLTDTLAIVFRPDSLTADTGTFRPPVLRYDCTDPGTFLLQLPDTGSARFEFNAVRLPTVIAWGTDSARQPTRLPRRLVRWAIDSGPFPGNRIPRVPAAPGRPDSVPVIGVVAGSADALLPVDTTGTDGTSRVRLRIRPSALGRDVVPARTFTVRLRALGQPGPRLLAPGAVTVRVQLERTTTPVGGTTATCP